MFDKQNDTARGKTVQNTKEIKKEVQTNVKPKTANKGSIVKGKYVFNVKAIRCKGKL